ncbi:hypothetical protein, partial [Phocaeicola coprophilus]|uniref:hypothetical protein n=1 Tax=Phocaeicola coprophilus TaxID=387090 RepID=UPI0024307609
SKNFANLQKSVRIRPLIRAFYHLTPLIFHMYVKERQIIFLDMSSIGAWSRIGNAAMSGPGFFIAFSVYHFLFVLLWRIS